LGYLRGPHFAEKTMELFRIMLAMLPCVIVFLAYQT